MARGFQVNGESLVRVKFGAHIPPLGGNAEKGQQLYELGLASEGIQIQPTFNHYDVKIDDFGPNVPTEMLWMGADVTIAMTLIHFDLDVLEGCIAESMGGHFNGLVGSIGTFSAIGKPMGALQKLGQARNHFMSLNLSSPMLLTPWRFPATYLTGPPVIIPLGTKAMAVKLNWRAIPYALPSSEGGVDSGIYSSGAVLWDYVPDTA